MNLETRRWYNESAAAVSADGFHAESGGRGNVTYRWIAQVATKPPAMNSAQTTSAMRRARRRKKTGPDPRGGTGPGSLI